MSERLIARMLAPVARAVGNMMARGTVVLANAATSMQTLQIKLLSGEAKDDIEHFEPYGITAHPKEGAEHVTLFLGGDRSHGITIMVADRRYRLKGLLQGEVALYDDLGHKVYLTRSGIVLDGGGDDITIQNAPNVNIDGNLIATGEVTANGIALSAHIHGDVQPGSGTTGVPQ